ncbi:MAG: UDP-N-acetylmuramate--L-alanine ligase [Sandaracinaceae bacterium]|nr:UDP-N-acetylmuramate--L-alanine ligase [Sandaracinaceae bacterium]
MFRGRVRTIHFVGIGGIGMSGIAEVLLASGFEVSGSDLRESENTQRLRQLGAKIAFGHSPLHVGSADVVVFSSAVKPDNPELIEAKRRGIPVISRAEMLAELMRMRDGIAIAGSHGKTTTTSLIATVLREAGLDPTVIIGGKLNALGSNAAMGKGEFLVAEADESDGSFLRLSPVIAVITNIDPEHLDHYGTHSALKQAFVNFANRLPFYGLVVACLDHPAVQSIIPQIEKRVVTYGFSAQANYRAKNVIAEGLSMRFDLSHRGRPDGSFTVRMPGTHNVLNALSVIAVADEIGVPRAITQDALAHFGGVDRRFTVVGKAANDITIIDDYAHHPAEIEATLEAAQQAYGKRLVVAFQPHRYTRTKLCFDHFIRAFNRADVLLIADIYSAGEAPIEGVSSQILAQAIASHGHRDVTWVGPRSHLAKAIVERLQPGDVVLTMGAGDITSVARELLAILGGRGME